MDGAQTDVLGLWHDTGPAVVSNEGTTSTWCPGMICFCFLSDARDMRVPESIEMEAGKPALFPRASPRKGGLQTMASNPLFLRRNISGNSNGKWNGCRGGLVAGSVSFEIILCTSRECFGVLAWIINDLAGFDR